MRESEGIFGVENAMEIFQQVPGDSGRLLKSVVITGSSSSFLPGLKGTFSVNQHCCFNHGTVLMVLRSMCCTCPVLFMLWILDTMSMCFPVDHVCSTSKHQAMKLSWFSCLLFKYLLKW